MQTRLSEKINLTPQPWNKNPVGYVLHQQKLKLFAEWLEDRGIEFELPPDRKGWDRGVDLIVAGTRIDLKTFGLDVYRFTHTWSSTYYKGRPAPLWDKSETDWFVHSIGDDVSMWLAAPADQLRTSKWGHAPYYFSNHVVTVDELAQDVFTSEIL